MRKKIEWLKDEIWYSDRNIGLGWKEFVLNLIDQLDEPEVLSQEWLDEHSNGASRSQYVWVDDLKELLVPKQKEVDRAYKDGYEKGKQHATEKQTEETETVAGVLADYLIASAKLKRALSTEVEEMEE